MSCRRALAEAEAVALGDTMGERVKAEALARSVLRRECAQLYLAAAAQWLTSCASHCRHRGSEVWQAISSDG
jgi:hypothetical protein